MIHAIYDAARALVLVLLLPLVLVVGAPLALLAWVVVVITEQRREARP